MALKSNTNSMNLFKEKILIILKNYVPMEGRELTPVESSNVANLALLALQTTELDETGSTLQATKCRNLPNL